MTQPDQSPRSLIRYGIGALALTVAVVALLWMAKSALLLIFAGVLFAAFLDAITGLLGRVVAWPRGIRLAIVCCLLALAVTGAIAWGGTTIAAQSSELTQRLRSQVTQVMDWLGQHGLDIPESVDALSGQNGPQDAAAARSTLQSVLPNIGGVVGEAWRVILTVLGVLGDALIIVFLGLFLAAQPSTYRNAMLLLAPRAQRQHLGAVLDESGDTLKHWLLGQSVTMMVIGVCVWLGLTLVGVQPAAVLGLQAGLFAFVPTLGPLLAGIVILLASLPFGWWGIIGGLGVYLLVQTLESYILTPLIQRRAISVPPGFIFTSQIILGVLFGAYGLALATPLAAVGRVMLLRLYVEPPSDEDEG